MSAPDLQEVAPAVESETRPMLWSMRRELWENRSIIIAPAVVASVVLFGFAVSTIGLPHRRRAVMAIAAPQQRAAIEVSYDMAAFMLIVTAFIVGFFYCLDALYGERRDRSILFWKSLPVSDLTTVLSKAAIPIVVLPLFIFAVIVVTQILIFAITAAVLAASGLSIANPWAPPLFHLALALLYCLMVMALWHAPVYGWLLMISGWAKRATFLWAVVPPATIAIFERVAFGTHYFSKLIEYRLVGWFMRAVIMQPKGTVAADPLTTLTPGRFLAAPGLWIGLAFAAVFLAIAVRLRRERDPI